MLVTQYNPAGSPLREILKQNWEILARNQSTSWIYDIGYKVGYRRPKNLRDLLMKAKLPSTDGNTVARQPKGNCNNPRCRYCPRINRTGHLRNSTGAKRYWTFTNINCESNNLIYCLRCKTCKHMYVGQTMNSIKERFGAHFYSITSGRKANLVARHFDSPDHNGIDDVEIHVLAFVETPPKSPIARRRRLHVEGMWQHRLNTIRPYGLNTLDEI